MSVHHSMISMFLYTHFYNQNTQLELCSMATRGRITAVLSTVLLSDAFTGVHADVAQGPNMADRTISACYDSHVFLICIHIWDLLRNDLFFEVLKL